MKSLAPMFPTQRRRRIALLAVLFLLGLGAVYKSNCWYGYETAFCEGVERSAEKMAGRARYIVSAYWNGALSRNGSAVVTPTEAVITFPPADSGLKGYHVQIECPLEEMEWPGYTLPERCGDYWAYQWLVFVRSPMDRMADRYRLPIPEGSGEMDGFLLEAELQPDSALRPGEPALARAMMRVKADADETCCHGGTVDSLPQTRVTSSLENGRVVMRLTGRDAVARVFGDRRRWVMLAWPTAEALSNEGWVWVRYRP